MPHWDPLCQKSPGETADDGKNGTYADCPHGYGRTNAYVGQVWDWCMLMAPIARAPCASAKVSNQKADVFVAVLRVQHGSVDEGMIACRIAELAVQMDGPARQEEVPGLQAFASR